MIETSVRSPRTSSNSVLNASWAAPTGIATRIEATTTRQKVIRDRASEARTETGRPASLPPRSADAIVRLSTAATIRPARAIAPRNPNQPSTPAVSIDWSCAFVMWSEATSSAQLARANGPTVPSTMMPM
jgi:hypothetical protein